MNVRPVENVAGFYNISYLCLRMTGLRYQELTITPICPMGIYFDSASQPVVVEVD